MHKEAWLEDHVQGRSVLISMAVDRQPHCTICNVRRFVSSYQPGSDGSEGLTAFALVPLTASLELEFALRQVVCNTVTCNMGFCLFFGNISGTCSNNDRQFNLPVHFFRTFWTNYIVKRATDGAGGFHEYDGLFRNG